MLILSPKRRVLSANPAALDLLDRPREQVIGRCCTDLYHGQSEPPSDCPLAAAQSGGKTRIAEMDVDRAGRRFLISCTPVANEKGDVSHVIHVATDVTGLREAQPTMQTQAASHSNVLESFIDPLHTVDAELRIRFANRAFFEWLHRLGMPSIEVGRNLFDELAFLDAGTRKQYEDVFRSGEILTTREVTNLSGQEIHTETRKIPVLQDGRVIRVVTVIRDITSLVHSRETLRGAEMRFHTAFDRSPAAMSLLDDTARISEANHATELLLGRSRGDLIGTHIAEHAHPEDRETLCTSLRSLENSVPQFTRLTLRFVHRDGREVWTDMTAQRVRETKASPAYLMVQWIDVTARRTAERALRSSEQMYRSLVQTSPDAVTTVDLSGHITFASPRTSDLCGYASADDMIGLPLASLIVETDRARVLADQRAAAQGRYVEAEYTHIRPDGSSFDASTCVAPLCDAEGKHCGYIGTTRDITERKATEEQLLLTKHSLDAVVASVFWVTPGGNFLYANAAANKNLGYSLAELRRLTVSDVDPEYPESRRAEHWAELKSAGALLFETTHRRRDGSTFPVEIRSQYVRYGDREIEFAIATDITARKNAETETAHLRAQLIQRQKLEAIGTLASGVAHEVNNPLTGVINYAQLIHDRVEDQQLQAFARGIIGEGERVARIVRSLLSFSRQETTEFYPINPEAIVHEALQLVGASLRRDRIVLQVEVANGLPEVICHAQRIEQVLLNLIMNARDAVDTRYGDGDPRKCITVTADHYTDEEGGWIRFAVEDTGTGVSDDIADRIFEPFFTTKLRSAGTGLGLSVSYGIMREHGGRLSMEAPEGAGARFCADLPLRRAPSAD